MHVMLWEAGWLQLRFDNGRTLASIAAEAGCTVSAVRHAAESLGVHRRRVRRRAELWDPDWLAQRYEVEQRSLSAIGRELGVSATTVSAAVARAGIAKPSAGERRRDQEIRADHESGLSGPQVARRFGVHPNTVYLALHRLGIPTRPSYSRTLRSPGWLAARLAAGNSLAEIAAAAGRSTATVRNAADRLGLPRRRRATVARGSASATVHDDAIPAALLDDAGWLRQRRAEGWSVKRLAAELDVDHHKISAALRRAGLPIPLPRRLHHPQLHDVNWLQQALASLSTEDVARQLGCAPQSVRYAARKYGVPALVNGHDPPVAVSAVLADRPWLAARRDAGATMAEMADELGTTRTRVAEALRVAGLPPLSRKGASRMWPELYDVAWVKAELAGKSRAQVARQLGCSPWSVQQAARRAGVESGRQQLDQPERRGGSPP